MLVDVGMSVCVCLSLCWCLREYARVRVFKCSVSGYGRMSACVDLHVRICACAHVFVCAYVHVWVRVFICMRV